MTEMFPPAVLYRLFKWLHQFLNIKLMQICLLRNYFVLCLCEPIMIAGCQPCDI